jgi:hypothetical protein
MTDTEKLAIAVKALRAIAGYCNQPADKWRAEHHDMAKRMDEGLSNNWKVGVLSDAALHSLGVIGMYISP